MPRLGARRQSYPNFGYLIANQQLGPGSDSFFAKPSILKLSEICSSYDNYDVPYNEGLLQYDDKALFFIAPGRQAGQIQRDKDIRETLP